MFQRTRSRSAFPAAAWLACSTAAWAAEEPAPSGVTALDTVVVKTERQPYRSLTATGATKTETPLKDLPQSVRVITADLLQDAGVVKLGDALELGSGIAKQSNLGGLWDSYAMRGFTGDPNFGSDYLVNGFNYSRGYNGLRDSANTASVEVLKGPASALYGRGEPGGTVNITTKKPLFQPTRSISLSAGSWDTLRGTVDLTGPINERIAYRLNAAVEGGNSFRDFVESERAMVSPSLIWILSENTTVSYELELSKQRATFDRGVVAVNGVLGRVPRSAFYGNPGDGKHTIETSGQQVFVQHYISDDWSLQGGLSLRDSSIQGISTEGRFLQADNRTLVRQRRTRDNAAQDLAGRLEALGRVKTGPVVHNLLFGVDAYRFTDERRQLRLASAGSIDIYQPVYGPVGTPTALNTDTEENQRAHAFYVQDQLDLSAQWKATLGLRHDRYEQSLLNRISNRTVEQRLGATTPRIGVVYQPTKQLSLYATASKSFRPNSGVRRDFTSFPAETGKAYELGVKLDGADSRLTGTLALYKITKQNVLTPDPVDPNNFSVAAGEVESRGLEFDLSGELTKGLRLSAAYAYTDAQVTRDNNAFLVGRQSANVPRHSGNLLLVQSFAVAGRAASLGAGVNHVGAREGAVAPLVVADNYTLPAYTTLKLIGSYSPTPQLQLSLDVDNLLDKTYYASSYMQVWTFPGPGRKVTLTARYRF